MRDRLLDLAAKSGFRGLGLLAFTAVCFAYGTALHLGYHPTFTHALRLSTTTYGWIFIGVGCFALTGVLAKKDVWHYTLCALAVWAWVFLIALYWTAPFGWGAAVSWMGVAGALIIAASWPEPPHRRQVAELEKRLIEEASEPATEDAELP